jgi:uncharacterized protein (DUF58 family)
VGDDLRYVDWNIYGRLDRLHVKLFVDEEDLCLHLIVDASASMSFGTPSKLECAVRIAAALGFVGSSTSSGSAWACSASGSPRDGRPRAAATR